jgi:Ca2+-binding RTX toxin-like protein
MKTLPLLITAVAVTLFAPQVAPAAPTNDNFAAATAISDSDGLVRGSNTGSSKELGEPAHATNPGGRSVWFAWTPPVDGTYVFDTFGSSFDTLLAVYTGTDLASLVEVASNDDAQLDFRAPSNRSQLQFFATAGSTYAIAVDGFFGKNGRFVLSWSPGNENDLFERATSITGEVGHTFATNFDALTEPEEPSPSDSASSLWYEWQAPTSRLVKFSTLGPGFQTDFDTVLAVYTGSDVAALTLVATNDDDPLFRGSASSFVGFDAVAGTTYMLAVGGWRGGQGAFRLNWSPLILGTPGNDVLLGTSGVEEIRGGRGNDVMRGFGGADVIVGGQGDDRGFGGPGNDVVMDHQGTDFLDGASGRDWIDARDDSPGDVMNGGPLLDACIGDPRDVRRAC